MLAVADRLFTDFDHEPVKVASARSGPLLDHLPDYRSDQESRSLVVSSGLALLAMAGIAPGLQRRKVA